MPVSSVKRWPVLVALAFFVAVISAGASPLVSATPGAEQVAGPATMFESWFEVEQPPTLPFEAVQLVVDFPVGSRVARHLHGGPGYITMLESELTMSIGADLGHVYGAGETFVEPFRVVAEGANLSATQSSLLVTYLIPVGSAVTTLEGASASTGQLPPGAVSRFESRMRFDAAPARYRLGQMLQTYAPGAWSVSGEPQASRLVTVVSGEVTVLNGATQKSYSPGQSWIETPGQAWLSGNMGSVPVVVAVSTTMPTN